MVRELVHDPMFLGIKSKPATKEDSLIARDLLDTLNAHRETCVGMAAKYDRQSVAHYRVRRQRQIYRDVQPGDHLKSRAV